MAHDVDSDRRQFLLAAMSAAAMGSVASSTAWARIPSSDRYLVRMLSGVRVGESFYGSWSLIDAYPPRAGGVSLVVARGRDEPVRVDVVRRGSPVRAPAYTDHLELYVMDGGAGRAHIPEDLVEALQHLAELLEDNEAQWLLSEELLTHSERVARYPDYMSRAGRELAPRPPKIP